MPTTRFRAYSADGEVLTEGNAPGHIAKFETEAPVSRVVFYGGPQESEHVIGVTDVGGKVGLQTVELTPEEE